jgi:predicted Zn-dependent protease
MRKLLLVLLVITGPWSNAGADDLPELGDASQATLSPAQERAVGENIMRQIRASSMFVDDAEVADYLNDIGYRLVAVSPDARQEFNFFALLDSSVNAFALPGGFIGVHSGLLLTSQSESELAAVLSHEVAHVTQRHIARLIAAQQRQGLASMAAIAIAILAARSNPQAAAGAIAAAQAQALSDRLAFTRDNEREADRIGLQILEKAGYDPHAMPVFLDRLQKANKVLETGAPTYMRTHPVTYERIADVQNRTDALGYRQVPDTLEYQLVRAKLRAYQRDPREAIAFFDDLIVERKFSNEVAARYGLVEALRLGKSEKRLGQELEKLRRIAPSHPMIVTAVARAQLALGKKQDALATLRTGYAAFPTARGLVYAFADQLIASKLAEEANAVLENRMQRDPNDGRLYELQAKAYSELGKNMLKHRSLAESYLSAGNLPMAIEQLKLALKFSDGDFYTVSSIEARIRELSSVMVQR